MSDAPAGARQPRRLEGRIALVTGASRGIGRAVALALARDGAHVVVAARTVGGLEELDDAIKAEGGSATILQIDLRRLEKVDQIGPTIFQRWGKLDILVGNAGFLGALSPVAHATDDAWTNVMSINLAANFRLIRTCDPLLARSDGGRAIFVTSGAAAKSTAYWGLYAASKAALETLVATYAAEKSSTAVRVNILDPGATATGMRAKAFPGEDETTLPTPTDIAPLFVELALPSCERNGEIVRARDWMARSR